MTGKAVAAAGNAAVKTYEELVFTDDFMFGKVMEDKELCREVLECLLGETVGELREIQSERQLRYTADGKPIRLDVYTRNRETMYDAEMQNLNHRTAEGQELPRRSRFYQSMMDADFLQKGNSYRKLPDGRVLFLCTFDPFGKGLPKYTFEDRCTEDHELILRDGTAKIFYNCTCRTPDMPEELKALYGFMQDGRGRNPLTEKLEAAVNRVRRNEAWKEEYMKELALFDDLREEGRKEGRNEGLELGRSEGQQKEKLSVIRNLSGMKLPLKQIAQAVMMDETEVRRLLADTQGSEQEQ